jgi:hypothetical protein
VSFLPSLLHQLLTFGTSENEAVTRGTKAVNMIYQLTARVPALIEQSHLERNEGMLCLIHSLDVETYADSVGSLLVSHFPGASHPMLKSMSGDKTASFLMPAALTSLTRACLSRSSRMDRNIWRSAFPADFAAPQA